MRYSWSRVCQLNSFLPSNGGLKGSNLRSLSATYFRYFSNVSQQESIERKCQLISENHDAIHKIFKFDPEIRKILLALTRFDLRKCYQHGDKITHCRNTQIKYITEDDLLNLRKRAQDYFEKRVVFKSVPLNRTSPAEDTKLEEETRLDGIDTFGLSFIDISSAPKSKCAKPGTTAPEFSHRVWERRSDGQLWLNGSADHCNRDKVIKSVYKKVYREPSGVVAMFEEQKFQQMLIAGHFQFLVDFAFQTFLLDDPRLKAILSTIFNYVCQNNLYDAFLSTSEHPLFLLHVLSSTNNLADYLVFLVQRKRASDILQLIKLKNSLSHMVKLPSNADSVAPNILADKSDSREFSDNANITHDAISAVNEIAKELSNTKLNDALEEWLNDINSRGSSERLSVAT